MGNTVLDAIADRRSVRGYRPDQITKGQLDAILKAAEQAPSARNAQPWHFTAVQDQAIIKEVNDEANKNLGREGDIFYGAPAAIFIAAESESKWSRLDCGIAAQTIALAAHSLGLGSVILGLPDAAFTGPRADYFHKLLKFPESHKFAVAIAIGMPAATKEAHPVEPGRIDVIS
jgi:nitroreductase